MKKPVVLRIYKGDQLLGVKQFLDSQIVIGRPGEVQVDLEGNSVSIIHAAIEERDSGFYICDLGSESGTFKNGERVLDTSISSGDILQVGDYKIEFYIGVPKPKAPPPSAPKSVSDTIQAPVSAPPTSAAPTTAAPPTVAAPPTSAAPTTAAPAAPPATPPSAPFEPVPVPADSPAASSVAGSKNKASESQPERSASLGRSITASSGAGPSIATPSPASSPMPLPSAGAVPTETITRSTSSFSLAGPKGGARSNGRKVGESKKKTKKTFAPASKYGDVKEFVKPSKGTVVEVMVAWSERVISTYHFSQKQTITIGSHPENDIVLPILSSRVRKLPILKIDAQAVVFVTPEMTGELVRGQATTNFTELMRLNRLVKQGNGYTVTLEQGELIKVEFGDQLSIIVRYVSDSPKPLVAPILDLTTAEFTGVVLSAVLVSILALYMFLYSPPKSLLDEGLDEPMRMAMIVLPTPAPLPKPPPVKVNMQEEPVATPPPQVVKATPAPQKETVKKVTQAKAVTNLTTKNDPGKSANAAPNKNKTGPRQLTSPKQGGSIKTANKEGSQMQSPKRDVTKSGLFSTFGGGGANDQMAQSTTGSGELSGLANAASGRAGFAENRAGKGLGSALKDTGQGGTGKALEGIAGGLGTQGRGSGNSGYGTGGLGNRQGMKIVPGGAEESISGTIDREAIRRVILANIRVIRTCYERQLNRNPDLFGKLILSWDIGEQGRVVGARVKSNELGNKAVADCIMDRLRTWKFPEPPTNQVVEVEAYPFFFSN